MDLFRVSDGAYERNKLDFSQFDTWHDLQRAISEILDIPVGQVIVFTDDGRAVDDRLFHELWERGQGARGGLYVFDREAFGAEPEEWVRGLEEEVVLDIELPCESNVDGAGFGLTVRVSTSVEVGASRESDARAISGESEADSYVGGRVERPACRVADRGG